METTTEEAERIIRISRDTYHLEALDRVISKKLTKDYPPQTDLAINVNLGCYGAYLEEGLPIFRDHTASARFKFNRVHILWEGSLHRFWEQGEYRYERRHYDRREDV